MNKMEKYYTSVLQNAFRPATSETPRGACLNAKYCALNRTYLWNLRCEELREVICIVNKPPSQCFCH